MGDAAVRPEDEGSRLNVRPAPARAGVTADGARGSIGVEAVQNDELESESLHGPARLFLIVRGERHDLRVERFELREVLLEVSQLLTTAASPVSAVKDQYGVEAAELVRYA